MGLLGDVGQVEVGGEGAHEPRRRGGIGRREDGGGLLAVGAHEPAHALDELEDRTTLLPYQRLAQQRAELADVATQGGVRVVGDDVGLVGEHRGPGW